MPAATGSVWVLAATLALIFTPSSCYGTVNRYASSVAGRRNHVGTSISMLELRNICAARISLKHTTLESQSLPKPRPKHRHRHRHRLVPGQDPGALSIAPHSKPPVIRVISYGIEHYEDRTIDRLTEIESALKHSEWVHWVDVSGLGDARILQDLGNVFHIHPLALEDSVHAPQRPKFEPHQQHLFIIAQMIMLRSERDIGADQVAIFLGKNFVLTLREDTPDCFEPVRERIKQPTNQQRKFGADFLCYTLLDAIVDHYFPVLEVFGEYLDTLEEETVTQPHKGTLASIHSAKRELLDLRRVLWPQREMISALVREDSPLVSENVRLHLRDCLEHSAHVIDIIESYREVASGLHDVYLSAMGQRTNEIMKVLTIISTIFIPLTFIAGIYGMNFSTEKSPLNMPELNWYYGYPAVLAAMLVIAIGLLFFFVRKGWILQGWRQDAADTAGTADTTIK
jgi:magnesium transporter